MTLTRDQQQMKTLLTETITQLCKNGLHFQSEFSVEGLIGITLDRNNVFLVSINETVKLSESTGINSASSLSWHSPVLESDHSRLHDYTNSSFVSYDGRQVHPDHRLAKRKRRASHYGNSFCGSSYNDPTLTPDGALTLVVHHNSSGPEATVTANSDQLANATGFMTQHISSALAADLSQQKQSYSTVEIADCLRDAEKGGLEGTRNETCNDDSDMNLSSDQKAEHFQPSELPSCESIEDQIRASVLEDCSNGDARGLDNVQPLPQTSVGIGICGQLSSRSEGVVQNEESTLDLSRRQQSDVSKVLQISQYFPVQMRHCAAEKHTQMLPIELVPGSDVYVSTAFYEDCHRELNVKGTKLVRRLVREVFPDDQVLAGSTCLGKRRPTSRNILDPQKVNAIKEFALSRCAELRCADVVQLINSVCTETRRSLRHFPPSHHKRVRRQRRSLQ